MITPPKTEITPEFIAELETAATACFKDYAEFIEFEEGLRMGFPPQPIGMRNPTLRYGMECREDSKFIPVKLREMLSELTTSKFNYTVTMMSGEPKIAIHHCGMGNVIVGSYWADIKYIPTKLELEEHSRGIIIKRVTDWVNTERESVLVEKNAIAGFFSSDAYEPGQEKHIRNYYYGKRFIDARDRFTLSFIHMKITTDQKDKRNIDVQEILKSTIDSVNKDIVWLQAILDELYSN